MFEIVCHYTVKQSDAKPACAGFTDHTTIPPVGTHVAITGTFVQEKNHAKWNQIILCPASRCSESYLAQRPLRPEEIIVASVVMTNVREVRRKIGHFGHAIVSRNTLSVFASTSCATSRSSVSSFP